jgi:predicted nucleotide-binding protein (sugar kinase/HSP70/actin superfamily)
MLRERPPFEIMEAAPEWAKGWLRSHDPVMRKLNTLGKIREHLYGNPYFEAVQAAREKLNSIEVDRLRPKPLVKITGEFWAQTTEGDGNFNMFRFLEREGAQVLPEPIATWVAYLLNQAKTIARKKHDVETHHLQLSQWDIKRRFSHDMKLRKKLMGLSVGEFFWEYFYHRSIRNMGDLTHHLVPQEELAALAHPYYHRLSRGGEGHLEIGKNIYYTVNNLCHMVLSLKPFGCMPSTQSDGAQSAVVNKYRDMIFLPIETSGEGEVNAHSRVQMALGEAKAKARAEFESCVKQTGRSLDELRRFVDDHPEMKRPFYHVPHRKGIAGTAAQFALHVGDRMKSRRHAA